jgi:PIN domain nuclease of toxin-antitoxin system
MRLLIDTHIFIWYISNDSKLSTKNVESWYKTLHSQVDSSYLRDLS